MLHCKDVFFRDIGHHFLAIIWQLIIILDYKGKYSTHLHAYEYNSIIKEISKEKFLSILLLKLPYEPVCPSPCCIGRFVFRSVYHKFLKRR